MVHRNSVVAGLVGYCILGITMTWASMRFSFSSFAILVSICAILHETQVARANHLTELQCMLADSLTCLGVITVLSVTWSIIERVIGCIILTLLIKENRELSWCEMQAVLFVIDVVAFMILGLVMSIWMKEEFDRFPTNLMNCFQELLNCAREAKRQFCLDEISKFNRQPNNYPLIHRLKNPTEM